jgi:hypothetical protein
MLFTCLVILILTMLYWFPVRRRFGRWERLTRISRASWREMPSSPIQRIQQRTRSRRKVE